MVIEDLKLSPRTFNQFKTELPDGLRSYYRKSFETLSDGDRRILVVAFRWLMCGIGSIDTTLIADECEEVWIQKDDIDEDGDSNYLYDEFTTNYIHYIDDADSIGAYGDTASRVARIQ